MSKKFTYEVIGLQTLGAGDEWLCQTYVDGQPSFSELFPTEHEARCYGDMLYEEYWDLRKGLGE